MRWFLHSPFPYLLLGGVFGYLLFPWVQENMALSTQLGDGVWYAPGQAVMIDLTGTPDEVWNNFQVALQVLDLEDSLESTPTPGEEN